MAKPRSANPRRGVLREFFSGVALLGRGLRVWATAPKLMLLGMIPALIVGSVVLVGIIALALNIENLAAFSTPFADRWDEPWRTGIRVVFGLSFLAVAILLVMFTFTTVTLVIGDPFYERIWRHVEGRFGEVPDLGPRGFWRAFWIGLGAGLRILIPTIFLGLGLFALGFIPLVGQILVPAVGALFGGWFLTLELTGRAFDSRGRTLRERRRALGASRAATVGFGAATYLSFLVPLGAVIMMPAAVAGSTLLARRALGEEYAPPVRAPRAAPRIAPSPPD